MKPSERIKQLATDIRNTDMLGNRLATAHTPKSQDYVEAIIQFLDEQGTPEPQWNWDADLAAFETLAKNLRAEGKTSRAQAVEYLIARCRRAEAKK